MGTFTNYLKDALLSHMFRGSAYTAPSIYVALFKTDPDIADQPSDFGGGVEQNGTGYARQRVFPNVGAGSPYWETPAEVGDVMHSQNNGIIAFTAVSGVWANTTYLALMDAVSGGNMLWWGLLGTPVFSTGAESWEFASGALDLDFDAAVNVSDYLESALLSHLLNGVTYTADQTWVGLLTAIPTDAGGGVEVTGGGYARQRIFQDGATAPNFTTPSFWSCGISDPVSFPLASADWGHVKYIGVYSASSGGQLLWWATLLSGGRFVYRGNTFRINVGELFLSLD